MKPFVYNILLLFLVSTAMHSQTSRRYEQPIATPLRIISLPDSLIRILNEDSLIAKTISTPDTVLRSGKSTTIALLASMLAPGMGQIYNGSYWKAPLVWGLGYYFFSVYKNQNDLYKESRQVYEAYRDSIGVDPKIIEHYKGLRDFYRGQRDTFGWYIAIAYVVNLLDAYVDASLFNFEVSPNLQPASEMRISVRVRF